MNDLEMLKLDKEFPQWDSLDETLPQKREDDITYIAMLSGGRDSTALVLRLLELGEPVDHIVFCDTTLEYDIMYDYIDKLDTFFQRKYNKKIVRLKPKNSFEHWIFGKTVKGDNKGIIRGVPLVAMPCYWRRESKEYPTTKWIKEQGITNFKFYIGYTSSEKFRARSIEDHNSLAPLIDWGWNEEDVSNYLRDSEMENPLYKHFSRTGCAVCPKQKLEDKYMIWKHYRKHWDYMVDVENKLLKLKKRKWR